MIRKKRKSGTAGPALPAHTDWRTTDADELAKRRFRAREEKFRITNLDPAHPVFSNFEIKSPSGMTYRAEIRDVASRQFSCTCTDFRINGLGTCKHIEAILLQLSRRFRAEFKAAERISSPRADVVADPAASRLRVERNAAKLPPKLRARFGGDGVQLEELSPEELMGELAACRSGFLRVSQDVRPWMETRARQQDRILSRRAYEAGVADGSHPEHVTHSADADRPRIDELFAETPWRGDKPTLQILDAATWQALENLAAAGMITIHTRATRPLLPADGQQLPPPLTPEQLARVESLRTLAAKKRRAAKALLAEELTEEAAALDQAADLAETEANEILTSGGRTSV